MSVVLANKATKIQDKSPNNDSNNDDYPQDPSKLPQRPLVARISLWSTRPGLKLTRSLGSRDSDNSSDHDDDDQDDDDQDFESDDNSQLEKRLKLAKLPEHVRQVATKELQKLRRTPSFMSDYAQTRSYLELLADLPWLEATSESIDLAKCRQDLDSDHYGMQKLKERVLQYLAVRKLRQSGSVGVSGARCRAQPILLFVGPPGTGKTSIAQSIASSLGRKFQRISLGGVADQSAIRGHRRTYVGAMPGRIIQGIKQASANNPVFLLDELDKLCAGPQGDPSGALLEVLDPEQNHTFTDHYLNIPFDLSKILFIATANSLDTIPAALLDRMEIIQLAGYTHDEKFNIAKQYLVPKQITEAGLSRDQVHFTDDALSKIIGSYAREAGVRALERRIASICRQVAVTIVERKSSSKAIIIDAASLEKYLGPVVYERQVGSDRLNVAGVAVGLAWNPAGGEITFVEAALMKGSKQRDNLVLTGQLGSVMRESAMLALNWVRANFHRFEGLPQTLGRDLVDNTVHVHFPAGAVGKDGPSAGVTIVVALMSLCSNVSVVPELAMTGEITLRGVVLKVGGVKSKVLAAHRAGIRRLILPARNEPDLAEIPANVKGELKFHLVSTLDEVIRIAFDNKLLLSHAYPMGDSASSLASKL